MYEEVTLVITVSDFTGQKCSVELPSWVGSIAEAMLLMREAHTQSLIDQDSGRSVFHPAIAHMMDVDTGAPVLSLNDLFAAREVMLYAKPKRRHYHHGSGSHTDGGTTIAAMSLSQSLGDESLDRVCAAGAATGTWASSATQQPVPAPLLMLHDEGDLRRQHEPAAVHQQRAGINSLPVEALLVFHQRLRTDVLARHCGSGALPVSGAEAPGDTADTALHRKRRAPLVSPPREGYSSAGRVGKLTSPAQEHSAEGNVGAHCPASSTSPLSIRRSIMSPSAVPLVDAAESTVLTTAYVHHPAPMDEVEGDAAPLENDDSVEAPQQAIPSPHQLDDTIAANAASARSSVEIDIDAEAPSDANVSREFSPAEGHLGPPDDVPIGGTDPAQSSLCVATPPRSSPTTASIIPRPPVPVSFIPLEPTGIRGTMIESDGFASQAHGPSTSAGYTVSDQERLPFDDAPLPVVDVGPAAMSARRHRMAHHLQIVWRVSLLEHQDLLFRDVVCETVDGLCARGAHPLRVAFVGPSGSGVTTTAAIATVDGVLASEVAHTVGRVSGAVGGCGGGSMLVACRMEDILEAVRTGGGNTASTVVRVWLQHVVVALGAAVGCALDEDALLTILVPPTAPPVSESPLRCNDSTIPSGVEPSVIRRVVATLSAALVSECVSLSSREAATVVEEALMRVWMPCRNALARMLRLNQRDQGHDDGAVSAGIAGIMAFLPLCMGRLFGFHRVLYAIDGVRPPELGPVPIEPSSADALKEGVCLQLIRGALGGSGLLPLAVVGHTSVIHCRHTAWQDACTTALRPDGTHDSEATKAAPLRLTEAVPLVFAPSGRPFLEGMPGLQLVGTLGLIPTKTAVARYGFPKLLHVVSGPDVPMLREVDGATTHAVHTYDISVFLGAPGFLAMLHRDILSNVANSHRAPGSCDAHSDFVVLSGDDAVALEELAALSALVLIS